MSDSDLSSELAEEIADAIFDDAAPTIQPVSNVYVTLFDATETERADDLENGRVETSPADWNKTAASDSAYENAAEIDFGDALEDIDDIEDVALYDAATGGNEIARYEKEDAPSDVSEGTRVFFEVGQLEFDILDRTQ